MTVSSTTTKNTYSGNGSTTAFAYGFKIFAATDLKVIIRSSAGVESVKSNGTHYNVSNVGNANGGNVTFTSGNTPASGETVIIKRNLTKTQATDYVANDPFPAETHEEALDRLTMITHQIQEEMDRTIKVSESVTDFTTPQITDNAASRASKLLGFSSNGAALEAVTGRVNTVSVSNVSAGGDATAAFTASTGALALGIPIGNTGAQGNTGATGASTKWTTGTSFPTSSLNNGDLFLFNSAVGSGLTWFDTDGSSGLSAAAKGDVAQYQSSGTKWVKQTNVIGSTGNTGAVGPAGSAGINLTWETATADSNQGNGKIWGNHSTFSSISGLYISDVDANSVNIESWIQALDDSTNTALRGTIYFEEAGTNSNFGVFSVTGACVDKTGYWFIPVSHVVSNVSSLADGDSVGAVFTRTGNKGADGADGDGTFNNFTLTADSGSNQTIADGNTLNIEGGEGIDTVVGATDKVTISGEDASTSNKGIASFHSDNFSVSSGAVTIKDQGVALAEIVNVSATDKILGRSSSGAGTIEEITCTAAGRALLDDADASAQRTTLGLAIGTNVQAYNADTVFKDEQNTFTKAQLASTQTADATGSVTLDFDTYQNFILTFTGNVTLAAPSTEASQVGQTGVIIIKQDGTGSRTLSLHGDYETPSAGGVGTISTAANAVDIIPYCVLENNRIMLGSVQIAFG